MTIAISKLITIVAVTACIGILFWSAQTSYEHTRDAYETERDARRACTMSLERANGKLEQMELLLNYARGKPPKGMGGP